MIERKLTAPHRMLAATLMCVLLAFGCMKSPEEKFAEYMENGLAYSEEGDWASALIEFKNAARTDSTVAEPYYQMALAQMAQGQMQDAVNSVRQAISIDPNHVEANLLLARFMVRLGRPDVLGEAEEILTGVLGETRDNSDALFILAATRARLGATEEASKLLQEALDKAPDHLQSSIALAKLRVGEGDIDGAEEILKEAVDKTEDKRQASIALGQFYMGANQPEKARQRFEAALNEDDKYGPALLGLGMLNMRLGEKEKAEEVYQRVSRLPEPQYRPLYGQVLVVNGKIDQAIQEFQRILGDEPDNRDVRNRLVATLLADDRLDDAQALLDEALETSESDTDARLQRAELLRRRGFLSEAEDDLNRVLEFRPDSANAHFYLSRVYAQQGNARLQRQELDEALRLDPNFLTARLDLAKAMLATPNPRSALEILDEAPEAQQGSCGLTAARIWALISVGDDAQARTELDKVFEAVTNPGVEFLVQDGMLKMRAKQYDAARASAEKAIALAPNDIRAINLISGSYAAEKRNSEAVAAIKKQADTYPESVDLQLSLAQWQERVGNKAGAREAYQKALSLGDKNQVAASKLAAMDIQEGNFSAAETKLKNALDDNASNVRTLLAMATVKEQQSQYAEAMEMYRRIIELRPDFYPALNNLAYLLATEANELDEALGFAQKAKELAPPDNGLVDDTIGWVFYLKGVYPTAVVHLRDAAERHPNNAIIQYHLAMAQAKSGNVAASKQAYESGLKIDPKLPEAAEAKKAIEDAE